MDDLTNLDLYDILGVEDNSDVQEIKKAYRKKALTCHPDKNPDDPNAVKLFLQLSKALEVLIDETAKASYDKILNARKAARRRHKELDSRRKKFKEELEAREREAEFESQGTKIFSSKSDEEILKERIDRLRKEGSRELQEEVEYIRKQILEELKFKSSDCRVKIRWNSLRNDPQNGGYNTDNLCSIFEKYGTISAIIVSQKKKGSALIEYKNSESAASAVKEVGFLKNPLRVELINAPNYAKRNNSNYAKSNDSNYAKANDSVPTINSQSKSEFSKSNSMDDFEANVLQMMKRAQERKIQIENVTKEENST